MTQLSYLRYATLTLALSLCGLFVPFTSTLAAPATAQAVAKAVQPAATTNEPAQAAPEDLSDLNADSNAPRVEGNIAELQNLVQAGRPHGIARDAQRQLRREALLPRDGDGCTTSRSRRTRAGGVSSKTQDTARAESIYAQFSRKSFELADGEIRRTQLQAQKALLDRVIAKSADRANRLTADLQLAQQQDSQVSQRQQQLQAESAVLQTDKLDAERKLRALQMQVEQLQKQTEAGLAPVSVTPSR